MGERLLIRGLHPGINEFEVQQLFSPYAKVLACQLLPGVGGAIVHFSSAKDAAWMVQELDENIIMGMTTPLSVQYAPGTVGPGGPAVLGHEASASDMNFGMQHGVPAPASGQSRMQPRTGDWYCPNCNDLQFQKNTTCRKCGTPQPISPDGAAAQALLPGDWVCPGCSDLQFSRNFQCRKCGTPKPEGVGSAPGKGKGFHPKEGDWHCPACNDLQFARNISCRQCGTMRPDVDANPGAFVGPQPGGFGGQSAERPGDWYCPSCNDMNYASRSECRRCGTPKPVGAGLDIYIPAISGGKGGKGKEKPGDWRCPNCNDLNFARNDFCRQCQTPKPPEMQMPANFNGQPPKPGDWNCPACGDLQFARNAACRKCGAPKPDDASVDFDSFGGMPSRGGYGGKGYAKPGDWVCTACGDLQFARNEACRKCGAPKPEGAVPVVNAFPVGMMAPPSKGKGGGFGHMGHESSFGKGRFDPYGDGKGGFKGKGERRLKPRTGDWYCPSCGDLQFADKDACRKCATPRPVPTDGSVTQAMMPGDWVCPSCHDLQFMKNQDCRKCGTPRPEGTKTPMRPGDWHCPGCGDLIFGRHPACRKCNIPKPADLSSQPFM